MKRNTMRASLALAIAACISVGTGEIANGQTTVTTVQTNAPAVIGYTAQPYGLFGLQTSYQPIVANVPVQKTVTVQQTPAYLPQPVTVQRPYVPPATYVPPLAYVPPATYVPAPVVIPTTYLAPVPPTPVPVTTHYTPYYPRY